MLHLAMRTANYLRFFILLLVLISSSFASFIYGDIYSNNLEKLNKTLIKIDGRFSYQFVTEKSNYSIFLPDGEFNITASNFDNNGELVLYSKEQFKAGDKDQKIDLVLNSVGKFNFDWIVTLGVLLISITLMFLVVLWFDSKKQGIIIKIPEIKIPDLENSVISKQLSISKSEIQTESAELDQDAKLILSILESLENRATQSELKDKTNFSDAKLSLILSELEQLGKIKKFKRGRGNIIRKL